MKNKFHFAKNYPKPFFLNKRFHEFNKIYVKKGFHDLRLKSCQRIKNEISIKSQRSSVRNLLNETENERISDSQNTIYHFNKGILVNYSYSILA